MNDLETAAVNMKIIKIVAYYRVSTKKQGRSGLGLEAQKEMVRQLVLAHGSALVAEYVEVETGKKSARPKLQEAIHHARLTNSTLVVAKLDRLARNCYFLNCLLHAELDFVCCDNPYADRFNIQVLAAVAEHEARQIAARTKAALAATKAKGRLLGSARPGHWDGRERGNKKGAAFGIGCQLTESKGAVSASAHTRDQAPAGRGADARSDRGLAQRTGIQDTANEALP